MQRKIGSGRTAEVFEWGGSKVMKLFYPRISKEEVESEYHKQQLLSAGLPYCAKVYGMEKQDDRWGILYEKVEGNPLTQTLFENPEKVGWVGEILGNTHRQIHGAAIKELPSVHEGISHAIGASRRLRPEWKRRLLRLLSSLPEGEALCHLDYHPDNVYVSRDRVMILDWMTAAKGHPLSDVARTEMILKYAVFPDVAQTALTQLNALRMELLLSYRKAYFGRLPSPEEEALLRGFETVHMGARLTEHLSEEEIALLEKELKERISATDTETFEK